MAMNHGFNLFDLDIIETCGVAAWMDSIMKDKKPCPVCGHPHCTIKPPGPPPAREITAEQQARDILERMEIPGAQDFSSGELVELANALRGAKPIFITESIKIGSKEYTIPKRVFDYIRWMDFNRVGQKNTIRQKTEQIESLEFANKILARDMKLAKARIAEKNARIKKLRADIEQAKELIGDPQICTHADRMIIKGMSVENERLRAQLLDKNGKEED